jgi:GT2 family glycosyltransferase
MADSVKLGIVIPTFNRKTQLAILLRQLLLQQTTDFQFKIIVVVDGSTDGTLELLKSEFQEVAIVQGSGHWWFTRSLNEGCKHAINALNCSQILTLNDDVQVPQNYLYELLNNYQTNEGEVIIGSSSYSLTKPSMITFSGIERKDYLLKYHKYIKPYTPMEPGKLKGLRPSITLPTRGLLVSAKSMMRLHYFDEKSLPQYSSDYEFVLRAALAGIKVFISYDAYVFEDMALTSQGNPRLAKSLKHFLSNVFFNKYSSNYFFKDLAMAWRFNPKALFPFYFILIGISIPYLYLKYKVIYSKKFKEQV